jgi:hypothetical protein
MLDGLRKVAGWTLFSVGLLLGLWGVVAFVANVRLLNRFGLLSSLDLAMQMARVWGTPLAMLGTGLFIAATGRWLLVRKVAPSTANIPSQFD